MTMNGYIFKEILGMPRPNRIASKTMELCDFEELAVRDR
jgi:hypothetical protein